MSRTKRKQSQAGIYHIMLRGINRQQIFYDEEDYMYFISLLHRFKALCGYELHAYCLMGNHVHLLIKVNHEPPGDIFRHIGSAFVYWYNQKYDRVGHLFQDRYKSEPVNDNRYYLTVLRYILLNPVAAGFCMSPETYPYSSAREYYCKKQGITDIRFALAFPELDSFLDFISQESDNSCLEMEDRVRVRCTDKKAKELILQVFGTFSPTAGKANERHSLNSSIRRLIEAGVSIRQLSRLTGLSKKIIETALRR